MAYVPPPTNQQPPRKQMGTFGAVFWGVLPELDEAGETADYWRKRAVELGTELEELRSAVEVAVNDLTSGLFDGLTGETLKDIAAPLAALVAPSVPETEETP
jgi:hypothetical protein